MVNNSQIFVCVFVCVSARICVQTAGQAPVSSLLVAKGNSRRQPCWLPTDLTLTPEVNTQCVCACACAFAGFITAYVTDWWSQ